MASCLSAAALAALAALCLPATVAAQAIGGARAMGLGPEFRARAMAEFKAQGFSLDARAMDLSEPAEPLPAWAAEAAAKLARPAVFSVVSGSGASASCWVFVRPQAASSAPEGRLARVAAGFGADEPAVWRAMFRHELGHCALAQMARSPGQPDAFLAEPFADVFALEWSSRAEPGGRALAEAFAQARARLNAGSHGTSGAIRRWLAATPASPCSSAWAVSPLDERPAAHACPTGAAGLASPWRALR